ncbi:DUF1934 domain-containing protein [Fusibacter sp. 3D3]|uniref:DUF1934 domain-containing protein n=1 Tax=Fusibacter sp. 3D3 TaxID=1048380 RepID=UPI000852A387|nr:DUF1934 domain-containing protein [Fusibacter sp. 3D3]GAU77834.1 DUF1934 domain-containing protein [Fusibacter sp. 3D3]
MNEILIKVSSKITNGLGETEEMTLYANAQAQIKEGSQYLIYEESEITGMEGTKTMLKYDGIHLSIKRFGNVSSNLRISLNETHENHYRTPYGVFTMITKGNLIRWQEVPLEIDIDYDLDILGNNDKTHISIEIRENQ